MTKQKKSPQELFKGFMLHAHMLMNKEYWLEQRVLGRVDLVGDIQLEIDSHDDPPKVSISGYTLDERKMDEVSSYLRKFVFGNEITNLGGLISALEKEYPAHPHLTELKNQWNQISERRLSVLVSNQRAVGIPSILDGEPLLWGTPTGDTDTLKISLLDTLEVFWYEGRLHAFEPGKNEEIRSCIRTIEPNLLRQLQHMTLAATIYMLSIAHMILVQSWPDAEKYCGKQCYEQRRIREITQENQQ